jgi:hypothetical protein
MTYQQIVDHYGSLASAAKELGFDKQRIFAWKNRRIPTQVQMDIAASTGLRPDAQAVREVTLWAATVVATGLKK